MFVAHLPSVSQEIKYDRRITGYLIHVCNRATSFLFQMKTTSGLRVSVVLNTVLSLSEIEQREWCMLASLAHVFVVTLSLANKCLF